MSIITRIQQATSHIDIEALLATLRGYRRASNKTLNRATREAQRRKMVLMAERGV